MNFSTARVYLKPLKDDLHNEGNSQKIKEDSDSKLLAEILDKFEKWKQIVETWCDRIYNLFFFS